MKTQPFLSTSEVEKSLETSLPSARNVLQKLEARHIIQVITEKARNHLYSYTAYLTIQTEGTELETEES